MKLLSVITTMDPQSGGPAQGIRNNIPYWESEGIIPSVLSFDAPDSIFLDKHYSIAIGPYKNKWAYVPKVSKWLINHLCDYDVVLIHGLWLYNSYVVSKVIRKLKHLGKKVPKVYIMPHGMLDPYFQKATERRLKAIRNFFYWYLIEKNVVNAADGILFTCEEELKLAETTFKGYRPKAVYNVGYGIIPPPPSSLNQHIAFYSKCKQVEGKSYFLFLSRIHQKKGVDILLKAYYSIFNYCKENEIELPDLVIAGPGMDTDYGSYLKTLQEQYPLAAKKIHFPGMLKGAEKWGALYGAELFILPSHQENFGIAIVEAMACKVPVLITKKVNIWTEIVQGESGIAIDDTLESLETALKVWIGLSDNQKLTVGHNGFKTYDLHFTAEATSKKFTEVVITQ